MIKDTLKKDKFIWIFFIFILGCTNPKVNEISRSELKEFIILTLNQNEIKQIYQNINDSINNWKSLKIENYNFDSTVKIMIDSTICMNIDKTKFITAKLKNTLDSHPFDGISYFYGVKIKDKWYFFDGDYMIIPRKNNKIPNTFQELSEMAYQNIFKGYLIRNEEGKLEINEHFFDDFTSIAWSSKTGVRPWDKESWDNLYLDIVARNRAKIDTNDYSKMK
jgi:hypothetical protein